MDRRFAVPRRRLVILIAVVTLGGATLTGQTATSKNPKSWTAPRGSDGHPDLSGNWEHNAATPLERPDEVGGRATLTDKEVAALTKKAAELFNGKGDAGFGDTIYIAALRN